MPIRTAVVAFCALVVASLASLSAHVIVGQVSPTAAKAFVSSPSAGTDAPIAIAWGTTDTKLRVTCFNVANTSLPRVDRPGWPRVTAVGLELPQALSGFSLVSPVDDGWDLVENVTSFVPNQGTVNLDFVIVARVDPIGRWPGGTADPRGIPPGQAAVRGSGTQFCVSGPFPDRLPNLATPQTDDVVDTTIEGLINGVVVLFQGVDGNRLGIDVGLWDNPSRAVPLYP